jgi:hypothetical protein
MHLDVEYALSPSRYASTVPRTCMISALQECGSESYSYSYFAVGTFTSNQRRLSSLHHQIIHPKTTSYLIECYSSAIISAMDAFTISTGVAGFLSLALEISKILKAYVDGVKSAPEEARNLLVEVTALCHALE